MCARHLVANAAKSICHVVRNIAVGSQVPASLVAGGTHDKLQEVSANHGSVGE